MKTFGSELERRRLAAGIGQDQLAHAAHVSRSTIQSAERNLRVSAATAGKIAKALKWDVAEALSLTAASKPHDARVVVGGAVGRRLRAAAAEAGQSIEEFLDALLSARTKGKK